MQEIVDFRRGCGHLVPGGYYLSSVGCDSRMGSLQAVTFPFGDSLKDIVFCKGVVPSRGMLLIDPAATFTLQSITTPTKLLALQGDEADLYHSLRERVLEVGLIDHVGRRHYTSAEFTSELYDRMPNRRVHPDVARKIAPMLPLPVIFTHSQIPVFRSSDERGQALSLYQEYAELGDVFIDTNWMRPEWGLFAHHDDGRDHFMIPILALLDKLTRDWQQLAHSPWWRKVKEFFDSLQYAEQPFAISWFVQAIRIVNDDHDLTTHDCDSGIKAAIAVPAEEVPCC